jgi:hypothetical protein
MGKLWKALGGGALSSAQEVVLLASQDGNGERLRYSRCRGRDLHMANIWPNRQIKELM